MPTWLATFLTVILSPPSGLCSVLTRMLLLALSPFFFRSHPPHTHSGGGSYALKDIVAFHAEDMDRVADECGLDFQEEAKDQLTDPTFWADEARLNQLRRLGIRFAKIRLHGGDVYCIPRKVVHQFQTVSGCISVTWHLKYTRYQKNMAGLEVPSLAKSSAATNGAPRPPKDPSRRPSPLRWQRGLMTRKTSQFPTFPLTMSFLSAQDSPERRPCKTRSQTREPNSRLFFGCDYVHVVLIQKVAQLQFDRMYVSRLFRRGPTAT